MFFTISNQHVCIHIHKYIDIIDIIDIDIDIDIDIEGVVYFHLVDITYVYEANLQPEASFFNIPEDLSDSDECAFGSGARKDEER